MTWIPVEERLPEDIVDVLCLEKVSYAPGMCVGYHNKNGWHPVVEMFDADNYDGGCLIKMARDVEIGFWMPLPEPPA